MLGIPAWGMLAIYVLGDGLGQQMTGFLLSGLSPWPSPGSEARLHHVSLFLGARSPADSVPRAVGHSEEKAASTQRGGGLPARERRLSWRQEAPTDVALHGLGEPRQPPAQLPWPGATAHRLCMSHAGAQGCHGHGGVV